MKEYIQKFGHAVSGITVYGEEDELAHVRVDIKTDDRKVNVIISSDKKSEVYTGVDYDLNKVNQVIEDYFMANTGDDEMSNTKFVANNGSDCPVCGSECISYTNDRDKIVRCDSCDSQWFEDYKLVGYDIIEKGEVND